MKTTELDMTIPSRIEHGLIMVGPADWARLAAEWGARHGQPRSGIGIIQRDQWISRRVSEELAADALEHEDMDPFEEGELP